MDYVKISRKILEWEWYKDVNTKVVFFHILLKANWKNGRFQGMEIPRGSFATSYQSLAEETGLTVSDVMEQADEKGYERKDSHKTLKANTGDNSQPTQ